MTSSSKIFHENYSFRQMVPLVPLWMVDSWVSVGPKNPGALNNQSQSSLRLNEGPVPTTFHPSSLEGLTWWISAWKSKKDVDLKTDFYGCLLLVSCSRFFWLGVFLFFEMEHVWQYYTKNSGARAPMDSLQPERCFPGPTSTSTSNNTHPLALFFFNKKLGNKKKTTSEVKVTVKLSGGVVWIKKFWVTKYARDAPDLANSQQ